MRHNLLSLMLEIGMSSSHDSKQDLLRRIRAHEVAISELKGLSTSRVVYQKNGNIFFLEDIKAALTSEQEGLDNAKVQLQKLEAVSIVQG